MRKKFNLKNSFIAFIVFVVFIAIMVALCGCGKKVVTDDETKEQEIEDKSIIKSDIYYDDEPDTSVLDESKEEGVLIDFTMSDLGDNVSIHTDEQAGYLADNVTYIGKYTKGTANLSACKKIRVTWDAEITEESSFKKYMVKVSDKKDFSTAMTFNSSKKYADIYNLKIGTVYYWRVYAVYANQTYRSQVMSFTTENIAPRNLLIEGIENVRDLGGWITEDGGTIRQGLVYRTSRLNENGSNNSLFQGSGKKMMNSLGIKTEIDLRATNLCFVDESPLGEDVNFINIPMPLDTACDILLTYPNEIKQVLEIFADENNYPIIFHCSSGVDRAGVIAFLLEGLLGLGEEDLKRDYLFSNFAVVGSLRSAVTIETYLTEIKKCEGGTLQEQFYQYLLGLGLEEAQLDNILRIMRTKPAAQ